MEHRINLSPINELLRLYEGMNKETKIYVYVHDHCRPYVRSNKQITKGLEFLALESLGARASDPNKHPNDQKEPKGSSF